MSRLPTLTFTCRWPSSGAILRQHFAGADHLQGMTQAAGDHHTGARRLDGAVGQGTAHLRQP